MNRADRLRKVAPGASDDTLSLLAALPADQVAAIAAFARQARRDERQHQAELKRQRKADDRRNHNYDESDFARRNLAVVASQGKRAGRGSLDALAALGQLRRHAETWIGWGVEGCRAQGYSNAEIGAALGVTGQAVGQRYGLKGSFHHPGGAA